jgi:glycosyltransferase involved in cell wall biosynthesis
VEKKGHDDLLAALARLPDRLQWRFELIGGGPLQQHIEKQARNLPANIQWRITGVLPHSQILQFYQENPH